MSTKKSVARKKVVRVTVRGAHLLRDAIASAIPEMRAALSVALNNLAVADHPDLGQMRFRTSLATWPRKNKPTHKEALRLLSVWQRWYTEDVTALLTHVRLGRVKRPARGKRS